MTYNTWKANPVAIIYLTRSVSLNVSILPNTEYSHTTQLLDIMNKSITKEIIQTLKLEMKGPEIAF